jgi:hypothetical protein
MPLVVRDAAHSRFVKLTLRADTTNSSSATYDATHAVTLKQTSKADDTV